MKITGSISYNSNKTVQRGFIPEGPAIKKVIE